MNTKTIIGWLLIVAPFLALAVSLVTVTGPYTWNVAMFFVGGFCVVVGLGTLYFDRDEDEAVSIEDKED